MPERNESQPRWPAWYGLAGLGLALVFTLMASVLLVGIVGAADAPGVNLTATLIQDAALVGAAVYLASRAAPPKPWQCGVRPFAWRTAIKWALIAIGIYLGFQILYVAAFHPKETQTTLKDLGAGNGTAVTVLIGVMVVGVAPAVEEFFFRGFFYGALRSELSFLPAALLAGLVFGGIHVTTGIQAVPPLMALGFALCLLYEATGSILPGVCIHALNNMIAFGADKQGSWAVGGIVAAVLVGACVTAPGRSRNLS